MVRGENMDGLNAAIIENNIVVNVVRVANEAYATERGWVVSDTAGIGDTYTPGTGEFSPAPLPVPDSVPALDALLALDAAGLASAYETWASDPDRTFAERAFINKAQNWRRNDPTLKAAAQALGLATEQVDQLFVQAEQLGV